MAVNDGDVLKVVVSQLLSDDTIAQNVYHYLAAFGSSQTNGDVLDALETAIETMYETIDAEVADSVIMDTMEVDTVAWDAGEGEWLTVQNIGERTPTVTNEAIADAFPNQVAATLGAYTTYPKVRGRKALPGFNEGSADVGELDVQALVALGLFLVEYIADVVIDGANLLSPGVASVSTAAFRAFGSGWINTVLGSQRRRKPGLGA